MMAAVRFTRVADGYRVEFRYDPTVVAVLKTVPARARVWDKALKRWTVFDPYGEMLAGDLARLGYVITGVQRVTHADSDPAEWARTLFHRVGEHRADAVFRALTRVLHPDNPDTGSTELQRELITAREQLRQGEPA